MITIENYFLDKAAANEISRRGFEAVVFNCRDQFPRDVLKMH